MSDANLWYLAAILSALGTAVLWAGATHLNVLQVVIGMLVLAISGTLALIGVARVTLRPNPQ